MPRELDRKRLGTVSGDRPRGGHFQCVGPETKSRAAERIFARPEDARAEPLAERRDVENRQNGGQSGGGVENSDIQPAAKSGECDAGGKSDERSSGPAENHRKECERGGRRGQRFQYSL